MNRPLLQRTRGGETGSARPTLKRDTRLKLEELLTNTLVGWLGRFFVLWGSG